MKLPRPHRPSPRRLSVAMAVVGIIAGLAFLLLPMEASLDDDPLLRLVPFSPALGQTVTQVDCGSAMSNFGRNSADLSIASLARDGVCRDAAAKRAASAVAVVAVIGVLGLITLAGARDRQSVVA